MNRPLPSSTSPHFQNETKCTTFLVKMSFICMRMKNHFHIKDWAHNLVLIQRPGELGNGLFFLHIIFTLPMNEKNHLIASLTYISTELYQASLQTEMFDANSCICENGKLQRNIWVCNQKFVVLSKVSF